MQPGDRIAIKSTYTRKYDLPFENNSHSVSVMAIKAIGTITENESNWRTVRVNWEKALTNRPSGIYTPIRVRFGTLGQYRLIRRISLKNTQVNELLID